MKNLSFILVFFMALLFSSVEANAQSYVEKGQAINLIQLEIEKTKMPVEASTVVSESYIADRSINRFGNELLKQFKSGVESTANAIENVENLFSTSNLPSNRANAMASASLFYKNLLKN